MEFRRVNKDEQEQIPNIISQAFFSQCEAEYKQLEKNKFRYEDYIAAFNDDGKIVTIIQILPHFMWLDCISVKSGGIANVASLLDYRRGGNVRKLMKLACDNMYNDDCIMSYLFPFSYSYYRKFGYELCCKSDKITAKSEDLCQFEMKGYVKQFEPGEHGTDPEDIITIYNEFASKFNIMCDRDAWQWKNRIEKDPIKTKTRTYVIYDENNNARSYFTYNYDYKESKVILHISDMAWLNYDDMYSLIGLISRLFGNSEEIDFNVPPNMMPSYIWKNTADLTIETKPNGMARIINAKKAFVILKKQIKEGSFTIKINDDFMEQNNKSYKISWSDGKTEVLEYNGKCDMECSIMALAQILTGFISLDNAISRSDLNVNDNKELLCCVFTKKDVFTADYF